MARYKDGALAELALTTKAEKKTRTLIRDECIDLAQIEKWLCPHFQRPVNMNSPRMKVVADLIAKDEQIPGTLIIGIFDGKLWRLDCQHRITAFKLSGRKAAFAKVQYEYHDSMESMAIRFKDINTPIEPIKRDDIYRCHENLSAGIKAIMDGCPYVGFGSVKRDGTKGAKVAKMSGILRYWFSSRPEVPVATVPRAEDTIKWLDKEGKVADLVMYLGLCHRAWHSAPEYAGLWSPFNMTLCMWLYRRIVLETTAKGLQVTNELFYHCLLSLTANDAYLDWLAAKNGARSLKRDRCEGYRRIKDSFARTIQEHLGKKAFLPLPSWMQYSTAKAA